MDRGQSEGLRPTAGEMVDPVAAAKAGDSPVSTPASQGMTDGSPGAATFPGMPIGGPWRVRFVYKDHRRKVATWDVHALRVWFGSTPTHYGQQWFLRAVETHTDRKHDFAMRDMADVTIDPA